MTRTNRKLDELMARASILFDLDANGGFTAVDTASGISAYAYPSSTHATLALNHPEKTAAKMIREELNWSPRRTAQVLARDLACENALRAKHGMPARETVA